MWTKVTIILWLTHYKSMGKIFCFILHKSIMHLHDDTNMGTLLFSEHFSKQDNMCTYFVSATITGGHITSSVKTPVQVFLVRSPNAAKYSAHAWWVFLTIHCAHFSKKQIAGSGQLRPPERACWPHLRKNCNHVRARFTERFPLFRYSLQYQYV